jgi:putative pyruvate formate lyase activating enzyme
MVPADIDDRIARARALMQSCGLCERRCGVDRLAGERGDCGLGAGARVFQELLHFGEELELVPSHAVYLTGCSFRCVFCMTGDFVLKRSVQEKGVPLEPEAFSQVVRRRRAEGATNLNILGGEPSVNLLAILELLRFCPPDTRLVWNSNMFYTQAQAELLDGVVDVYLGDWKFGADACAQKLAGVRDYLAIIRRNFARAHASGARVIVRHLVMPGHVDCCTEPVLAMMREGLPGVPMSLLDPYVPLFRAHRVEGMDRQSTPDEARRARALAESYEVEVVR